MFTQDALGPLAGQPSVTAGPQRLVDDLYGILDRRGRIVRFRDRPVLQAPRPTVSGMTFPKSTDCPSRQWYDPVHNERVDVTCIRVLHGRNADTLFHQTGERSFRQDG